MLIDPTRVSENTKKMQVNIEEIQEFMVKTYLLVNILEPKIPLKQFLNNFEKKLINIVLILTKGNQRDAASILGIKATTLFEKMKKHGIKSRLSTTKLNNLSTNKVSEQIFSLLPNMPNINDKFYM